MFRRNDEEPIDKDFLLQVVQPSLNGLIDGSVSTLAPIFAAAYASGNPHVVFLVGTAAAVGSGISMAFAEGLSDTGEHTGRGHPFVRGGIVGLGTFIGGILHTLPFLLSDMTLALYIAYSVVALELLAIGYIRYRYYRTGFWSSVLQVLFGGVLVLAAGIMIGHA